MREVYRSINPAEIAVIRSFLESHGIAYHIFDEYSNQAYGSLISSIPSRIMVEEEMYETAVNLLNELQDNV